jgi:SAM-dependent methyltransferase
MHYGDKSPHYFSNARTDIKPLLPPRENCPSVGTVMEVGCGNGATLAWLKQIGYVRETIGIEMWPAAAAIAKHNIDRLLFGDATSMVLDIAPNSVDGILCLDVLEHLEDPWTMVDRLVVTLKPGGWMIASIPNVRRLPVLWNLVFRGRFEYTDTGTLDRTHLRFFTRKSATDLLYRPPLKPDSVTPAPHARASLSYWWNLFSLGCARDLVAEQYLIKATKVE